TPLTHTEVAQRFGTNDHLFPAHYRDFTYDQIKKRGRIGSLVVYGDLKVVGPDAGAYRRDRQRVLQRRAALQGKRGEVKIPGRHAHDPGHAAAVEEKLLNRVAGLAARI